MQTYFTAQRALFILCLMTMPALAGCHTAAGFGRDVQQVGSWIEGGANDTGSWLYGSDAQAAEAQTGESPAQAAADDAGTSPEESVVPAAGNNVVYFSTGSAEIPTDGIEMIRSIAGEAQRGQQGQQTQAQQDTQGTQGQQGMPRIEVVGYTDSTGSAEFNAQLSQRRAEAVADALAAEGLPRESIAVRWHGEEQLSVPTGDNVHEPENRRVSIVMTGT